jgi:hypothetical protein
MGDYVFEVSIVNVSRDGADDSGEGRRRTRPERRLKRRQPAAPLSLKLLGDEADQLHVAAQEMMAARRRRSTRSRSYRSTSGNSAIPSSRAAPASSCRPTRRCPSCRRRFPPKVARKQGFAATATGGIFGRGAAVDGERRARCPPAAAWRRAADHGDGRPLHPRHGRGAPVGAADAHPDQDAVPARPHGHAGGEQQPAEVHTRHPGGARAAVLPRGRGLSRPDGGGRDAVEDLRTHQSAMVKAMQAAFRDLLGRLSPDPSRRNSRAR